MELYKHFIICCYIFALSQCNQMPATWNCDYKKSDYWYTNFYKSIKTHGYTCHLKSTNHKYPSDVNFIIGGNHVMGNIDENVEFLRLKNNINRVSLVFCQKFANLKAIKIKDNEIGSIDEFSLQNCKNLEMLRLEENKLHQVPEKFLPENSQLTKISISKNRLRSLPEKMFVNQNNLKELVLEHNHIDYLPLYIFHPLYNLQYLNLNENKLQILNVDLFVNQRKLRHLNLEKNHLLEIPGGVFRSLENLKTLSLEHNRIRTFFLQSFDGLRYLEDLNLSSNDIVDLPTGLFVPLKNLKKLNMNKNKLSEIHSDSFGSHSNQVTDFYLHDNQITAFDEKVFDMIRVKNLDMKNNLCCNQSITSSSEMKEKLRKCFLKYQPRNIKPHNCGTSGVTDGVQSTRSFYPWVAVLENANGEFLCTGTLVSDKKVVTAANCIRDLNAEEPTLNSSDFKVLLGVNNLNDRNEVGREVFSVQYIRIHPSWNSTIEGFNADIAYLVLEQRVEIGQIQPICLIDRPYTISLITRGAVVGFQNNEDKTIPNVVKAIETPIDITNNCLKTSFGTESNSSNQVFCGVVCNINSGSGFYVFYGGAYYLRGIASESPKTIETQCDPNSFSIFMDMLKFNDFVKGVNLYRNIGNSLFKFPIFIYFLSIFISLLHFI